MLFIENDRMNMFKFLKIVSSIKLNNNRVKMTWGGCRIKLNFVWYETSPKPKSSNGKNGQHQSQLKDPRSSFSTLFNAILIYLYI